MFNMGHPSCLFLVVLKHAEMKRVSGMHVCRSMRIISTRICSVYDEGYFCIIYSIDSFKSVLMLFCAHSIVVLIYIKCFVQRWCLLKCVLFYCFYYYFFFFFSKYFFYVLLEDSTFFFNIIWCGHRYFESAGKWFFYYSKNVPANGPGGLGWFVKMLYNEPLYTWRIILMWEFDYESSCKFVYYVSIWKS